MIKNERYSEIEKILREILENKYKIDLREEEKISRENESIEDHEEFDSIIFLEILLDSLSFYCGKINEYFLPFHLFLENLIQEKEREEIQKDFYKILEYYISLGKNLDPMENNSFFILFDYFEILLTINL